MSFDAKIHFAFIDALAAFDSLDGIDARAARDDTDGNDDVDAIEMKARVALGTLKR